MDIIEPKSINLSNLLADLIAYLNPEYLLHDYASIIRAENINKKKVKKYYQLILHIDIFYRKINRYELYFSEFYSNSKDISEYEALEHHIHAYLEDLDILRNKINVFLNTLKGDLKKIAINKNEIDKVLSWLVAEINRVFKNVGDSRGPHHHDGMKFIDVDLVDSEFASTILGDSFPLKEKLNPEFINELKERKLNSFQTARQRWIARAHENSFQISGLIDDLMGRNKNFILKVLQIKSLTDLLDQDKK